MRGGKNTTIANHPLPWSRTGRVVSSCHCATLAPVFPGKDGPGRVAIDLTADLEAKSFAPTFSLLDRTGAEIAAVAVDVEVAPPTAVREAP